MADNLKRNYKFFLTFFIIYVLFVNWEGWATQSLFVFTRALVDEGKVAIDSHYQTTVDRLYVNGHYYSNKPIGGALVAAPVYAIWKVFYHGFFTKDFVERDIDSTTYYDSKFYSTVKIHADLSLFERISQILVTIFTSSLLATLTAFLIYKTLPKLGVNGERNRLFVAFIFGFGTTILYGATAFFTNTIGMFFGFLAFYLLLHSKQKSAKFVFLAGVVAGFSVAVDYWNVLLGISYMIYLALTRNKMILYFILGSFIGVMPQLLYQYHVIGDPFKPILGYQDKTIWTADTGRLGFKFVLGDFPYILKEILFSSRRGLFFLSPILMLSLLGILQMYKKHKHEALLIFIVLILFILANSLLRSWWVDHGSRYMYSTIPFLVLPLAYIVSKKHLVLPLLMISILINLSAFQNLNYMSVPITDREIAYQNFIEKAKSFDISGPFLDKHIPSLIKLGPRSQIIESLSTDSMLDIRLKKASLTGNTPTDSIPLFYMFPLGYVKLSKHFLSLFVIALISLAIWRKELRNFSISLNFRVSQGSTYFYRLKIFHIWVILIAIFLIFFVGIKKVDYKDGWYQNEIYSGVSYRWMSQNATVGIHTPKDTIVFITFETFSYYEPKTLQIVLGDRSIGEYNLSAKTDTLKVEAHLKRGENILKFQSKEGCKSPLEMENKLDPRCLSFRLSAFRIREIVLDSVIYGEGWFKEEKNNLNENWRQIMKFGNIPYRWMSQDATVSFYSQEEAPVILSFNAFSFEKTRNLEVSANNDAGSYSIKPYIQTVVIPMNFNKGKNVIKFHSREGCDTSAELIRNFTDLRCRSFAIYNIDIEKLKSDVLLPADK